jgi:hypothetical protein
VPVIIATHVNENSSCRLRFLLTGLDGVPVPSADITVATLDLIDKITNAAIGASARDVSSKFIDAADYNFSYVFDNLDNAIISTNDELNYEVHVAKLKLEIDAGGGVTLYHEEEFYIRVERHRN